MKGPEVKARDFGLEFPKGLEVKPLEVSKGSASVELPAELPARNPARKGLEVSEGSTA